jgi:hypothetical protein
MELDRFQRVSFHNMSTKGETARLIFETQNNNMKHKINWHDYCRLGHVKFLSTISCKFTFKFPIILLMMTWPPLLSSGQSSWLQIQGSRFDCRHHQIFWEVVGLEWDPLSLVSTTKELLGRKSSGSGLENREYGNRDLSRWSCGTLYLQKLALTSPTSSSHSVGIDRSQTQATEFSLVSLVNSYY